MAELLYTQAVTFSLTSSRTHTSSSPASSKQLTVSNVTAHLILGHNQVFGDGLLLLFVVGHLYSGYRSESQSDEWSSKISQSTAQLTATALRSVSPAQTTPITLNVT